MYAQGLPAINIVTPAPFKKLRRVGIEGRLELFMWLCKVDSRLKVMGTHAFALRRAPLNL